jgi:CPA2 family monovalent cation:H+ antiporter-2
MKHILLFSGTPPFFTEIAALLVGGALVAYLVHRIRLIPIIGFLIAGVLIGPNGLGIVQNQAMVDSMAEVGVILLLFTIGIEFSLEKLAKIQRLIFGGGGLQVGLATLLTMLVLLIFGVSWQAGLFTGFLISLSSTAIVLKILGEQGNANSESGQVQLGLLIFQDLAIIVMVMLVPMLSPTLSSDGSGTSLYQILWALGKAGAIILLVLLVARRVMPKLLEVVSRTCSQEIFLLTIIAICFGTAYLTSLAGVSLSLGAFLAGLIVSESKFSNHALSEIMPLQTLFSAMFFVSVGMLLNLGFLMAHLPLVLLAIVLILAIKVLTTAVSVRALGYASTTATYSALMLAQIGEFSFVLERIGREVGLFPAGLEDGGSQAFIAATVVLMALTPLLGAFGNELARRLERRPEATRSASLTQHQMLNQATTQAGSEHMFAAMLEHHVVIAGYGEVAQQVAKALQKLETPFAIITLSPSGASEAEASGYLTLRGDSSKQQTLQQVGIERAKVVVILDDDIAQAARIVNMARFLNASAFIVVRTRFLSDENELKKLGANRVIVDEMLPASVAMQSLAESLHIPQEKIAMLLERDEEHNERDSAIEPSKQPSSSNLITFQTNHPTCTHLTQIRAVSPSAQGCEECLKTGERWVHLRICMTCGHVGCCDSSKHQHAAKHAHESGHSIMRSFEPGETWGWCYTDKIRLEETVKKQTRS